MKGNETWPSKSLCCFLKLLQRSSSPSKGRRKQDDGCPRNASSEHVWRGAVHSHVCVQEVSDKTSVCWWVSYCYSYGYVLMHLLLFPQDATFPRIATVCDHTVMGTWTPGHSIGMKVKFRPPSTLQTLLHELIWGHSRYLKRSGFIFSGTVGNRAFYPLLSWAKPVLTEPLHYWVRDCTLRGTYRNLLQATVISSGRRPLLHSYGDLKWGITQHQLMSASFCSGFH